MYKDLLEYEKAKAKLSISQAIEAYRVEMSRTAYSVGHQLTDDREVVSLMCRQHISSEEESRCIFLLEA
jgi:hypothetical protein